MMTSCEAGGGGAAAIIPNPLPPRAHAGKCEGAEKKDASGLASFPASRQAGRNNKKTPRKQDGSPMLSERIPLCWFDRHAPDRDAVEWDGYDYVGNCRHCRTTIRRRGRKDWKKDWKQRERAACPARTRSGQ
jgi:hypothetical protein